MYTYCDLNILISCFLYLFIVLSRCLGIPRPECCCIMRLSWYMPCILWTKFVSYVVIRVFTFNFILIQKCFFPTFQIHFGCCTVDILKQISGEEISHKPPGGKPGDRIGGLATHILKQQRWLHLFMQLYTCITRDELCL